MDNNKENNTSHNVKDQKPSNEHPKTQKTMERLREELRKLVKEEMNGESTDQGYML